MNFAVQLREAMGPMTQEGVARRAGISQPMVSAYLRGKALPKLPHLDALELALPRLREIRDRDRVHQRAAA